MLPCPKRSKATARHPQHRNHQSECGHRSHRTSPPTLSLHLSWKILMEAPPRARYKNPWRARRTLHRCCRCRITSTPVPMPWISTIVPTNRMALTMTMTRTRMALLRARRKAKGSSVQDIHLVTLVLRGANTLRATSASIPENDPSSAIAIGASLDSTTCANTLRPCMSTRRFLQTPWRPQALAINVRSEPIGCDPPLDPAQAQCRA